MRSPGPNLFDFITDNAVPATSPKGIQTYQDLDWSAFMFSDPGMADQALHGAGVCNPADTMFAPGAATSYTSTRGIGTEVPETSYVDSFGGDPGPSRHPTHLSAGTSSTVPYRLDWGGSQGHTVDTFSQQMQVLTGTIRTQPGRLKRRQIKKSIWPLISNIESLMEVSRH